jgi:hypothetical protein
MRKRVFVNILSVLPVSLLVGCGGDGAEDFAVEVKRPVAAVYAPLSAADVRYARFAFPGIGFERSRPSDSELLYTIPGTGAFPATIRLKLEPATGGATTVIHAFVHVPPVHARIDGEEKVLSERKAETALQSLLKSMGRSLEMGSNAEADTTKLSAFLTGIAIASNETYLAKALDFKAHPEKLVDVVMAFEGVDEPGPTVATERDTPMVDTDASQRQHEFVQDRSDLQQQEAAEKAAEPTNNLDRYDN